MLRPQRRTGDVLLSLKLDMNHVKEVHRKKGSILNLGEFGYLGAISPKTAVDIYEAFTAGTRKSLTKEQEMLMDLLNGCKRWEEIHEQTGLPQKRCEEIYEFYMTTDRDLWLKPKTKES
jgi:hypothetical protein